MTTKDSLAAAKTRMEKAVEDFRKDVSSLRTGRANAMLLDSVRVDYHGTPMPVNQLGTVTVPDATMLVIAPWDASAVAMIDKVKLLHKMLENHRTAVRNVRRDSKEAIEKLEKEKKISEDEKKRALDELEKISHAETKKIEDLSAQKEKEVMGF
jgi:ribosome recycling factor